MEINHRLTLLDPYKRADIDQPVLVVEDEISQRMLLRNLLEEMNINVIEAANGREALEILKRKADISLVLTDLTMPELDGFELIKEIRAKELSYTYIIVITARRDRKALIKALSLGADDYVSKPVFPEELALRIKDGQRLQRLTSHEYLILSMAKLAEYRSPETGYHVERVRAYCQVLGLYLSENYQNLITNSMAQEVARLSVLHDIGKVTVPDHILHKPGPLTKQEFEIIKKHTVNGGKIIKELYNSQKLQYLKLAYEIVMYHHERYDGKGYPAKLKGEEIPLSARIVSLADVYDAITSKRCYKDAATHEKAKEIIVAEKGKQFDPKVVDAFLAIEDKFIEIAKKYKD